MNGLQCNCRTVSGGVSLKSLAEGRRPLKSLGVTLARAESLSGGWSGLRVAGVFCIALMMVVMVIVM